MTADRTALREKLEALAAQWAESADHEYNNANREYASALDQCANDLTAVLAILDAETGTGQDSAVRAEVMAIYQAFEMEALNGVICSIPDTGLDTPPHRTWCARCQRRWKRLRAAGAESGTEPAQEPKHG